MRTIIFICCLFGALPFHLRAQSDSAETLQWVEKQSVQLESILQDGLNNPDQVNIIFRLLDAYAIFDAVALTGVYCTEVREAAQAGRNLTDVLNYRLEKDVTSAVLRSSEARVEAEKMRLAAQSCLRTLPPQTATAFFPNEIILEDARSIELMLSDGMAVGDMHILSQKIEYAIRGLYDIRHLASTLQNCSRVAANAQSAISNCEAALSARNWTEVNRSVNKALEEIRILKSLPCR